MDKISNGVTAIVCNRDEPNLLESFYSIYPHVEYVVISDASEDKTPVKKLMKEEFPNTKFNLYDEPNLRIQNLDAFKQVNTRWILRWDADFIALPKTGQLILDLSKTENIKTGYRLSVMNSKQIESKYSSRSNKFHREIYFFGKTPKLLKNHLRRRYASLRGFKHSFPWRPLPFEYKIIDLDQCLAIHQLDKPEWRLKEKDELRRKAREQN